MAVFLATPQTLTIDTEDAWTELDVSAHVSASATGVIMWAKCASWDTLSFRKKGSADTILNALNTNIQAAVYVGVDGSGVLEYYSSDTVNATVQLLGYFESEATFLTNVVSKKVSTDSTWEDVDITAQVGGDAGSVVAAIFMAGDSSNSRYGWRAKGSSDNNQSSSEYHHYGIVHINANDVCEAYTSNASGTPMYLVGWMTDGVTCFTDQDELSDVGSTWTDNTPNASAIGAFGWGDNNGAGTDIGARKNGQSTYQQETNISYFQSWVCECDGNGTFEYYSEGNTFSVSGYFTEIGGGPAPTAPPPSLTLLGVGT